MKVLLLTLLMCFLGTTLQAMDAEESFTWPEKDTFLANPVTIIWYDRYTPSGTPFDLTLTDPDGNASTSTINPQKHDYLFFFRLSTLPADGIWKYSLQNQVRHDSRYLTWRRYPIEGSFTLDSQESNPLYQIPEQSLADYLWLDHLNTLENTYNSRFFLASGTLSAIAGIAFWMLTDWGIWTRLISGICLTSAGCGLGASAWYTWQSFSEAPVAPELSSGERRISLHWQEQF